MKFEEWLSQQDGVIEVDCGCVTAEAFYHWMRVAYEAGNSPVVPDERDKAVNADDHPLLWSFNEGWNACRAAMLNQAQEPATYNTAPQPAAVSEKIIDNFEEEFRRAFEVSAAVEQLIEIGYQGDKFSLSIRDAATLWKLGRAAMLAAAPQEVR